MFLSRSLYLICVTALFFASAGICATDILILPDSVRQTIDGVGFCHEGDRMNGNTYIISNNIQAMINENMSIFRDMFPNRTWEPVNDNSNPHIINNAGFGIPDARCTNCLRRLKEMQNRGIKTILGIWDLPTWMKSGNTIGNMDEAVETICAFLLYGKQQYDLTVDQVDFNESEKGVNIKLTSAQYIEFIQKFAAKCKLLNLSTKACLTSSLMGDQNYVQAVWDDSLARAVGGNPCFHSYENPYSSANFLKWGAFRLKNNRNLWCTETDYDWQYYSNPDRYSWIGAREQARNYWSIYYLARASTSAGWYWYPSYPSAKIHTAYMNQFDPGGLVLECAQPNSSIMTVAYKHPIKNKFVLMVLNIATTSQDVTFIGVPQDKQFNLIRTANNGDRAKPVGTISATGNRLTVQLLAESFNTFVYTGPAVSVAPKREVQLSSASGYKVHFADNRIRVTSALSTKASIRVSGLTGRVKLHAELTDGLAGISTSELAKGLYCVNISGTNGCFSKTIIVP